MIAPRVCDRGPRSGTTPFLHLRFGLDRPHSHLIAWQRAGPEGPPRRIQLPDPPGNWGKSLRQSRANRTSRRPPWGKLTLDTLMMRVWVSVLLGLYPFLYQARFADLKSHRGLAVNFFFFPESYPKTGGARRHRRGGGAV